MAKQRKVSDLNSFAGQRIALALELEGIKIFGEHINAFQPASDVILLALIDLLARKKLISMEDFSKKEE